MPKCIDRFTTGSKGHIDDIGLSLHNPWGELAVGKRCFKVPKEKRVPNILNIQKLQKKSAQKLPSICLIFKNVFPSLTKCLMLVITFPVKLGWNDQMTLYVITNLDYNIGMY